MQKNERLNYIDAAKGLAVIFLVTYHILNGYWQSNTYSENAKLNFALSNIIISFVVNLFYMLSGVVYEKFFFKDNRLKKDKWLKQIVNIFILYVLYEIVYIVFKSFVSSMVVNPVTIGDIKYIWKQSYGPYWYLYDLFAFYIIFAIPQIRKVNSAVIALLLIAVSLFWSRGIYAVSFYLGMMLGKNDNIWVFNIKTGVVSSIAYIISAIIFWKDQTLLVETRYANLICSVCASVFIVSLFKNNKVFGESKMLSFLGKKSMEIFLWHQPIIMVCRVLIMRIEIIGEFMAFVITMILSVGIPVAYSIITSGSFLYNIAFKPSKLIFNAIEKRKTVSQ